MDLLSSLRRWRCCGERLWHLWRRIDTKHDFAVRRLQAVDAAAIGLEAHCVRRCRGRVRCWHSWRSSCCSHCWASRRHRRRKCGRQRWRKIGAAWHRSTFRRREDGRQRSIAGRGERRCSHRHCRGGGGVHARSKSFGDFTDCFGLRSSGFCSDFSSVSVSVASSSDDSTSFGESAAITSNSIAGASLFPSPPM